MTFFQTLVKPSNRPVGCLAKTVVNRGRVRAGLAMEGLGRAGKSFSVFLTCSAISSSEAPVAFINSIPALTIGLNEGVAVAILDGMGMAGSALPFPLADVGM